MLPLGGYVVQEGSITINEGRERTLLQVSNTGDRPIQVGSHYHFAEVNPALQMDRQKAQGLHLDIPSGTSRRFEPGQIYEVTLVPFAGSRIVVGFRNEDGQGAKS